MSNGNVLLSVRFKKETEECEVDLNVDLGEGQIVLITPKQKEHEELAVKTRSEHYVDRMLDVVRGGGHLSDAEKRRELTWVMEDLLIDLNYYDVVTTHRSIVSRLARIH